MFPSIPVSGSFSIPSYSVLFFTAIAVFFFLLRALFVQSGLPERDALGLTLIVLITGFSGGKTLVLLNDWKQSGTFHADLTYVRRSGFSIIGGMMFGLIGASIYVRARRLPYLKTFDLFVIPAAFVQAIMRMGCFLNGCCFGKFTRSPLGIKFPFAEFPLYPTQLYESAFCIVLAGFLYWMWKRNPREGVVGLSYFVLYPAWRFGIEFLRGDVQPFLFSLTISQWLSLLLMATALLLIRLRINRPRT